MKQNEHKHRLCPERRQKYTPGLTNQGDFLIMLYSRPNQPRYHHAL